MSDKNKKQDLDFEQMMKEKINTNFGANTKGATSERLKDVNKKLPSWNLEPPYNFIK